MSELTKEEIDKRHRAGLRELEDHYAAQLEGADPELALRLREFRAEDRAKAAAAHRRALAALSVSKTKEQPTT